MAYRAQFQKWAPGRSLVTLHGKAMHPDIYDLHCDRQKFYGLYAWNFRQSKARHPTISQLEVQNKLYNSALLVNNWLLLQVTAKGGKSG